MSYKVEAIKNSNVELGEGPHWDIERQSLYFVDIDTGRIFRYDYNADKIYSAKIEGETFASFIIPVDGAADQFLIGCGRRVQVVQWNGTATTAKVVRTLFEVQTEPHFTENRINDGKCDSKGRLFAGTMRQAENLFEKRLGELYHYEKGGKVELLKADICISNGLAWNDKLKKFYYNDTGDYEVKEYDYDLATGKISNPKITFDFRKLNPSDPLLPDGMTIDTDGNIYVATFNGHTVFQISSSGKILKEIKLPCKQITSVAFGGPNLDILFVTTSSLGGLPEPAGTTFKITGLGAKGFPMTKAKI